MVLRTRRGDWGAVQNCNGEIATPISSARNDTQRNLLRFLITKIIPNSRNDTSSVSLRSTPVSLRLGHGTALTVHRTVIHSRVAVSLPSRGRLWRDGKPVPYATKKGLR